MKTSFFSLFDGFLLDLDGTLTDSKPGICNCIRHALEHFGVESPDDTFLNNLIGPPLADSFARYFNFSADDAQKAIAVYRERYEQLGIHELTLYPHVKETLIRLNESGKTVALATSKVGFYAQQILDNLGISEYFHHIQGGDMAGKLCGKSDVVRICLDNLRLKKEKCVMIGDRKYDIIGAKDNGIRSIGVRYGYAEEGELESHGADYIINDLTELR